MTYSSAKNIITELLKLAGITIDGSARYDIQVHNEKFYTAVLNGRELGLGESYMDGWWDCAHLDEFFDRVLSANLGKKFKISKLLFLKFFFAKIINFQNKHRAWIVGKKHYDLSDDLFRAMLDSNMNYTCGYWKDAKNLEEAQRDKVDLVCQKLFLKPGMRLLDIGCGWGALAKHAALEYGAQVTGVTISHNQFEHVKKECRGLPVKVQLQDYRDIGGQFDRICSLGMFEHVGASNYSTYMQIVRRCLTNDGLFLLHTIGDNDEGPQNEWMAKYIFPNGVLPTISLISKATEGLFVMEDWHNFGADYDKTLMAWQQNFQEHWPALKSSYDERFYRLWNYYLLSCAGSFRARNIQLWQIVFSKEGVRNGYQAPRTVMPTLNRIQDLSVEC